jgi:ABC-type sugar transport system ATPase subunit
MLRLEQLLDRRPAQLSGGQRQRVAIGRALVREPKVFLFDEPLSNLDAMLRVQMRLELAKLHQDVKTTMIYVTHDQVEAMTLADRIIVLDKGVISQVGTPLELYNRPANKFVAAFIGSPAMNMFEATISGQQGNQVSLTLPGGHPITVATRGGTLPSDGKIDVGVRPEHLRLGASGNGAALDGSVSIVEQLGNATLLYVDTPAGQLIVEGEGNMQVQPGASVGLTIDADRTHLFGRDEQVI